MKKMKKLAAAVTALAMASVSAMSIASWNVAAVDGETEAEPYSAWLNLNAGGSWFYGNEEGMGEMASIPGVDGDGTYTATLVIPEDFGGTDSISCFYLSTDINAYAYVEDGLNPWESGTANVVVDSITIDHAADGTSEDIAYNGPSEGALFKENNGTDLRVNIYNTWTNPSITDISETLPTGLFAGDTLSVTFTVSGINAPYDNDFMLGDIDGDKAVTIQDAFAALVAYANTSAGLGHGLTDAQFAAADIDGSGNISISDAFKILTYYAENAAGLNPSWD